jgi:hypothetical protein
MGGESSKIQEESIRAQYLFVKSLIKKRNMLEYQINNLKIRHYYSRLNTDYKVLKDLQPFRKTLKSSMAKTKKSMKSVKNREKKIHSFLPSEEITNLNPNLSKTEKVLRVLSKDITERLLKTEQLASKLQELKKTLQKKRKFFESNKKKIHKLGIVTDLVHGRRKTTEIFQDFKEKSEGFEKEIIRIDSISTSGSSHHLKNVSAIPMEFCHSDDDSSERLNYSFLVSPSCRSKKLKRFKSFAFFPERTLSLRSKLILKEDLENTVFSLKNKMFKRFSRAASQSFQLENLVFALENDPQLYLKQLEQEILAREQELDVEVCKREYLGSVISAGKGEQDCDENQVNLVVECI